MSAELSKTTLNGGRGDTNRKRRSRRAVRALPWQRDWYFRKSLDFEHPGRQLTSRGTGTKRR